MPRTMNKHGYQHVRKVNDGRPKPYLGRIWIDGEIVQTSGYATPIEAHRAAIKLKAAAPRHSKPRPPAHQASGG